MIFYRCEICGDVYMGTAKPSHCPFCGSNPKYLVTVDEWADENSSVKEISELSRKNLRAALQLEVDNAPFYRNCSANAQTMEMQGIFKGLAKIEAEHASVINKILKSEPIQPAPAQTVASSDDTENLKTSRKREREAAALYRKFHDEAVEPRIKKVFSALIEVETDHIMLEDKLLALRAKG